MLIFHFSLYQLFASIARLLHTDQLFKLALHSNQSPFESLFYYLLSNTSLTLHLFKFLNKPPRYKQFSEMLIWFPLILPTF